MPLDAAWALDWARRAALLATENRAELTELDRAIGDADHGDNLDRGMKAVVTKLNAAQEAGNLPATPGGVLKLIATTLMATVGGAGGPLLGTAFLRAARSSDAPAWGGTGTGPGSGGGHLGPGGQRTCHQRGQDHGRRLATRGDGRQGGRGDRRG